MRREGLGGGGRGAVTELSAVQAEGLVKNFEGLRAVDGIDLHLRQGEIFGVLGPNGAGKTTMLRMLATLLPIDGGRAEIFGVDVRREPHRIRQLVGVTGQYASVDEDLAGFRPSCRSTRCHTSSPRSATCSTTAP
jgi:ABC-2 type transport system ATP-binding protein